VENLDTSSFEPAEQLYLGRSKQFTLVNEFKLRYEIIEQKKKNS
jgi:hypothetical protein